MDLLLHCIKEPFIRQYKRRETSSKRKQLLGSSIFLKGILEAIEIIYSITR